MKKVIVAAVSENGVIGRDGDIPWYFPEDLKHFKEVTLNNPVVMGRKTFESLPEDYKPLPDRTNIVLTRSGPDLPESVKVVNSLEDAWSTAEKFGETVYVIGGSSIYEQTLEDADKLVLTRIHDRYDGDTFFPDWNEENWRLVEENNRGELSFLEYVRS